MENKRAYTNYASGFRRILKSITFEKYMSDLEKEILESEKLLGSSPEDHEKRAAYAEWATLHYTKIGVSLEYLLIGGGGVHLFLPDKAFCDWIVSCVQKLEPGHTETIIQMLEKSDVAVLNFQTASKIDPVCFTILNSKSLPMVVDGGDSKVLFGIISLSNKTFTCKLDGRSRQEYENLLDEEMWYIKLIVGLGMYLSCFPDQIKPGIPDDLKHPNHFKGLQARTIGISEKVVMRDGPTPHYRVGHFRFLESERYKNKRGQAVFVHGCFVKGKAETVLAIT